MSSHHCPHTAGCPRRTWATGGREGERREGGGAEGGRGERREGGGIGGEGEEINIQSSGRQRQRRWTFHFIVIIQKLKNLFTCGVYLKGTYSTCKIPSVGSLPQMSGQRPEPSCS